MSPVASAPTNLTAVQEGLTSIRVSWSPPTPLGDTTGYRIYYSGGSNGSVNVSGGSTDNYLLTGLQNGESYTVSIVATSQHLFSDALTQNVTLSEIYTLSIDTIYNYVRTCFLSPSSRPAYCQCDWHKATSISMSWIISSGSVVDSHEVMWQRDTSGECSDEDEGNTTITDGSTRYDIMGLAGISSYTITVTATNVAGSSAVGSNTAMTLVAGA